MLRIITDSKILTNIAVLSKQYISKLQTKKGFQREIPFSKPLTALLGFDLSFWLPVLGLESLSSSSSSSETYPKCKQQLKLKFPKTQIIIEKEKQLKPYKFTYFGKVIAIKAIGIFSHTLFLKQYKTHKSEFFSKYLSFQLYLR